MENTLNFRPIVIALAIACYGFQPLPTPAQGEKSKVRFYCALSQDGKLTPITFVGVRGSKAEHRQIVRWSDYDKQTAEQRCREGSNRFQAAWDRGEFHKLVAGTDSNRKGIICALSYRQTTCDRTHQLFVLKGGNDSQEVIRQLKETMGGKSSKPTSQSGQNEIDMQQLIESIEPTAAS
jgi:hypothetical protein